MLMTDPATVGPKPWPHRRGDFIGQTPSAGSTELGPGQGYEARGQITDGGGRSTFTPPGTADPLPSGSACSGCGKLRTLGRDGLLGLLAKVTIGRNAGGIVVVAALWTD